MFTHVYAKIAKVAPKCSCKTCNYNTSNNYHYKKYLLTAKNKMFTHVDANVYGKIAKNPKIKP